MSTAIIGLASSGKTTVFNALTRGVVDKGIYGNTKSMNLGVGSKPDSRLDFIARAFKSRKKVRAEMPFWDMPSDYVSGTLFSGETINALQKARVLLVVVRAFDDPAVPHPDGDVDWLRDAEKILFEILFADIALIDRRIERINTEMKSMKSGERSQAVVKIDALKQVQYDLESGIAIRSKKLGESEQRVLSGTFALSALPVVIAVNMNEDEAVSDSVDHLIDAVDRLDAVASDEKVSIMPISASLEEELRSLRDDEADELRLELGLDENGSEKLMDACLSSLNTLTFYTASEKESRAWHFPQGYTAPESAGIIHSDMERGFIRAEVVSYNDFTECGSMVEARKRGLLRQEGKDYLFADGDIANFLFSV